MEKVKENDLNFIISQNKVFSIDKIKDSEIKAGWKLSEGFIFETSQTITILDKDYGKSAELMRSLLEEESGNNWILKTIFLFWIGLIFICITIFLIIFLISEKPKDNIIIKKDPIIQKQDIELIEKSKWIIKNDLPKENINIIQPLSFEVMQKDFDIKTLSKENIELKSKNEELKIINNLLIIDNEELKQSLEDQKEKNSIKEDKNNSLEEFKKYLGYIVYTWCTKAEEEGKINKCKDLYYNFVKKND